MKEQKLSYKPETRRLQHIQNSMNAVSPVDRPLSKNAMRRLEIANIKWLNEFFYHGNMPNFEEQRKEVIRRYK